MTRYIPAEAAEPLSEALWSLSRPERTAADTQYLFGWIESVQDGSRWLQVPTTYTIPVHPNAVLNGIADILEPWIAQELLPADTNENLAALVASKRGDSLTVYDAFPQLFKDMSKSYAEMIELGHLPAPMLPP